MRIVLFYDVLSTYYKNWLSCIWVIWVTSFFSLARREEEEKKKEKANKLGDSDA